MYANLRVGNELSPRILPWMGSLCLAAGLLGVAGIAPAQQQSPASQGSNDRSGERITVHGQVLDTDGKPVRGVEVRAVYTPSAEQQTRSLTETRTDGAGGYQLSFLKPRVPPNVTILTASEMTWADSTYIVVSQPGFGVDTAALSDVDPTKSLILRLIPDTPLQGRLLDLTDRPLQGATVEILLIAGSNDDLKRWLELSRAGSYAGRPLTKFIHR